MADTLMREFEALRKRVPLPADRREADTAPFEAIAYHYGLALELAAKGAIAAKTGAAPKKLNHKLGALCKAAGVQLTADEQALAERLTAAIEWWGRYAAPKKAADFADADKVRRLVHPLDRRTVGDLVDRLSIVTSTYPPRQCSKAPRRPATWTLPTCGPVSPRGSVSTAARSTRSAA